MAKFTLICYTYRDYSNYKQSEVALVKGKLTFEQIEPYLSETGGTTGFCPVDVGLPHPGEKMSKWGGPDDHPYCELEKEDFTFTDDIADANRENPINKFIDTGKAITANVLLNRFKQAHEEDWPHSRSFV